MNTNIYKNIAHFSFYMLQSSLNRRIVFPLAVNARRNIRQVARPRVGNVATQLNEPLLFNSDTPDLSITETAAKLPPNAVLPSTTSTSVAKEKRKKPQYPSPTSDVLPSEKKKQKMFQLNENIFASPDLKTVFNIYFENKNTLELDQYVFVLQRLSKVFKGSSVSVEKLHESKEFQSLCHSVWKQIPKMDAKMVLATYKSLAGLKLHTKSLIRQALLQMARHQINIYTIEELIYLNILLSKETENCNLKNALELAIPKVVENSIDFHFPSHLNFLQMNKLLDLCITKKIRGLDKVLHFIDESSLPSLLHDTESPTLNKNVLSLLSNLLNLDKYKFELEKNDLDTATSLMVTCLDCLTERNLEGIHQTEITAVLRKLVRCYKNGFQIIFHEEFLSKVVEKCLDENWGFRNLFEVVKSQASMYYVNNDLVYLVTRNVKDIAPLVPDAQLLCLIPAIASANLSQGTSEEGVDIIMKNLNLEESLNNMKIPWIRILLNLFSMDYFDPRFTKRILNEDFLLRYLESRGNAPRELLDVLRVHKCLEVLKRNSEFEVPSRVLSMAKEASVNYPLPALGKFLESILGNNRCIVSNVDTPQNNHIDHIIVLNEDGKPVEMSKAEILKSNDIPSMRKFAIMEVPDSWTMRPGYNLRGSFKLEMQLIEEEGFVVVPIYQREIETLQEASKIGIKNKLKDVGFAL